LLSNVGAYLKRTFKNFIIWHSELPQLADTRMSILEQITLESRRNYFRIFNCSICPVGGHTSTIDGIECPMTFGRSSWFVWATSAHARFSPMDDPAERRL
jgi:hypothetical protein